MVWGTQLIICDGFKIRGKNKFRSGEINQVGLFPMTKKSLRATPPPIATDRNVLRLTWNTSNACMILRLDILGVAPPTLRLKATLSQRLPGSLLEGAKIVELGERNGFGFAMKEGLKEVTTPYIIVVQHDRNFKDSANIIQVVAAMNVDGMLACCFATRQTHTLMMWFCSLQTHSAWMHYVGLPTAHTVTHQSKALSKYRIWVEKRIVDITGDGENTINLVQLVQW